MRADKYKSDCASDTHPLPRGADLMTQNHACGVRSRYRCLSYTARLVTFLPLASVPVVVTVRVRPLAETTIRPVRVTLSSFFAVNANVRLFIFR